MAKTQNKNKNDRAKRKEEAVNGSDKQKVMSVRAAIVLSVLLWASGESLMWSQNRTVTNVLRPVISSRSIVPDFENKIIIKNVGSNLVPRGSKRKRYEQKTDSPYPEIPAYFFHTAVEGVKISAKIPLQTGTFDVELGFAQVGPCLQGKRIFHIFINGHKRKESLDLFKLAGCFKAKMLTLSQVIVDPETDDGLIIHLQAVSGTATLSYIRVKNSNRPCLSRISQKKLADSLFDHYAHSVPGTYPHGNEKYYVDSLGKGYREVQIDGSGSHTHYNWNGYTARLISFIWTVEDTGKVISRQEKFKYKFSLGTTILKLEVLDTVCSKDEKSTAISVTSKIQSGEICYMYQDNGFVLKGNFLTGLRRPMMSFKSRSLNIKFPNNVFKNKRFSARCIFLIEFPNKSLNSRIFLGTASSGIAHLCQGRDRLYDSASSSRAIISSQEGDQEFELTYRYSNLGKRPALQLKLNEIIPSKVSYDYGRILPIISTISSSSGSEAGGTEVKLNGYNFPYPLSVYFGNKSNREFIRPDKIRNCEQSRQVFTQRQM